MATLKTISTSPINIDIFSVSQLHSGRSGKHLPKKRECLLEVMKKASLGVLPLANIWTDKSFCEKGWMSQGGLLKRAAKHSTLKLVSTKGRKVERGCGANTGSQGWNRENQKPVGQIIFTRRALIPEYTSFRQRMQL